MQGASICVAILVTILFVIDGVVALYACLLWPRKEAEIQATSVSEPLFVVGIVTFVVCFTLPFVLITGFLVMKVFVLLASNIASSLLRHDVPILYYRYLDRYNTMLPIFLQDLI